MTEIKLQTSELQSVKKLLFKAAFKGGTKQKPVLPDLSVSCDSMTVLPELCRAYNRLLEWQYQEYLHPAFPHLMAMPLHLNLLLDDEFPFPTRGLVHISNQINQYVSLSPNQNLSFRCYPDALQLHHKGWLFNLVTEAYADEQLAWQEQSTFLSRQAHPNEVEKTEQKTLDGVFSSEPIADLAFARDIGRRYASLSGDYNPIHLWPWSARLMGFKQHIAHGMYSMARCASTLVEKSHVCRGQLQLNVNFKRPLFLPGNGLLYQEKSTGQFCLKHQQQLFLTGTLT